MKNIVLAYMIAISLVFAQNGDTEKSEQTLEEDKSQTVQKEVLEDTTTEEKIKETIESAYKDSKNIYFSGKLTNVQIDNSIAYNHRDKISNPSYGGVVLATLGINFFPNTWDITLSYSGQVADSFTIYGDEDGEEWIDRYGDNSFTLDEGEIDMKWINLYIKPISTKYGEIGFGYKYNNQNILLISEDASNTTYKIYDVANSSANNAKLFTNTDIRAEGEFNQYYITYNIPKTDSWYNGFGFQYGYETSDFPAGHTSKSGFILHPDATTHLYALGFKKQLQDIKSGLSFKTFQIGANNTTYKYYDYEIASNSSFKDDGMFYDIEAIFMFKPNKKRQIYLSFGRMESISDSYDRDEFRYELGVVF